MPPGNLNKFPPITEPSFTEDGRRLHRFRQSSLRDIDLCLERARRVMSGTMPKVETDAACAGTAVHAGIEMDLLDRLEGGPGYGVKVLVQEAQDMFTELAAQDNFVYVKRQEPATRRFITNALLSWYALVRPQTVPHAVEVEFGPLVIHEDEFRVIELTGTIDYLDGLTGLKDWKTSGRPYEKWEKERFDLQSAAYTMAAVQIGLVPEADNYPFEFVVMVDHRADEVRIQRVPLVRHRGHFAWFIERTVAIAKLVEAGLDVWPKNDNTALCSPKWCPAWSTCKGKHFAPGWPRPDKPA